VEDDKFTMFHDGSKTPDPTFGATNLISPFQGMMRETFEQSEGWNNIASCSGQRTSKKEGKSSGF
jgi:hypothetical protein